MSVIDDLLNERLKGGNEYPFRTVGYGIRAGKAITNTEKIDKVGDYE